MNNPAIEKFVTIWLTVNAAALVVLAVMSYVGAILILEGVAWLDRWLMKSEHKRTENLDLD